MIKAVIFDMDGVIVDSEPVYLKIQWEYAKKKNPDVTYKQLFPMVGATKMDAWSVMEKEVDNGQTWQELRTEFKEKIDLFTNTDYQSIFRPEIKSVLDALKNQGYKLAVASSTQIDVVEKVMKVNSIYSYFDTLVSGDQFTMSKPDPEIYHYTAKKLGVKENECFVVEDSPYGILAAKRAGMTVAALYDSSFHFDQHLADYHIQNVKEILDILLIMEKS